MFHKVSDANVGPTMPPSGVEEGWRTAGANAASDTRVTDINFACGVPSRSDAKSKTSYVYTQDARQFGAMFSDCANSFMFDRRNVRHDTDMGAWNIGWAFLWRWCPVSLKNVSGFDTPIVHDAEDVDCLRRSLRLVLYVDDKSKYCGLNLCCFEDSIDRLYLAKDADAWTLGGVSRSPRVGKDFMRGVHCLSNGIAWRCLRYRLTRGTTSTLRYCMVGNTNQIVLSWL